MLDPNHYVLSASVLARFLTASLVAFFAAWGLASRARSRLNQTFFLMTLHAFWWNFGSGFVLASTDPGRADAWYRFAYLGVAFIGPGVLLFASSVVGRLRQNRAWILAGYTLSLAWAVEGVFGHFVIRGAWETPWGYYPRYGPGGFLFVGFFLVFMALSFRQLLFGLRAARSRYAKKRIQLTALSLVVAFPGALDFLPAFGVSVYPIGFVFFVFFIVLLWWSNYRYQVLNPTAESLAGKVLATVGDAIIVLDSEGFIRMVNPRTEEILGYSADELLDRPLTDILTPVQAESLKDLLSRNRGELPDRHTLSLDLMARDGSLVATSCTLASLPGWRKDLGTVLACRDIREVRQKEEELRRSERRFRTLIEDSSDLITVLDASGNVTYQSYSNERVLGFGNDDALGKSPFRLLHPEDVERVLGQFQGLLANPGGSIVTEYRLQDHQGSWRWIESIARNLLEDAAVSGVVINSRDITERKKIEEELRTHRDRLQEIVEERTAVLQDALKRLQQEMEERKRIEEELRKSEERFRSLVLYSSDIIVVLDPDGTRRYVSPAVERIMGYRPEDLMGKSAMEWIHPDDVEKASAAFQDCLSRPGSLRTIEYRVRHKNGSWRTFEAILNNLTENPAVGAVIACARDITKRKEYEAEIRQLNEGLEQRVRERTAELEKAYQELRELDRLKDSFLSTVSHEFRTPLTAIRSFSEILLRYEDVDDESRKEFLGIINSESERLTRMINDVLDLSRIRAGRMSWQDEPFCMADLIRDVVRTHGGLLQENGLKISVEAAPDLPFALADPDKIRQVLTNLLSNAIKFSRPAGEIRIRADAFAGKRSGDTGSWLQVSVADQGIGIEEKHFQLIFEHFRQIVDDTLTDKPKGSGLGLPICKEIVTHYGGNIWVESQKGRGSTFFFTLPATTQGKQESRPQVFLRQAAHKAA